MNESPNLHLNAQDISILLTALNPIRQFFPDLEQKLVDARKAVA